MSERIRRATNATATDPKKSRAVAGPKHNNEKKAQLCPAQTAPTTASWSTAGGLDYTLFL